MKADELASWVCDVVHGGATRLVRRTAGPWSADPPAFHGVAPDGMALLLERVGGTSDVTALSPATLNDLYDDYMHPAGGSAAGGVGDRRRGGGVLHRERRAVAGVGESSDDVVPRPRHSDRGRAGGVSCAGHESGNMRVMVSSSPSGTRSTPTILSMTMFW